MDVSNIQYISTEKPTNMPVHGKGGYGTYADIKSYILDKYGMKVSSLYIGQVKSKVGIKERVNYNIGKGKSRACVCPIEKEKAIIDAFSYYGMI